jgi:hypothetical protein
MLFFPETHDNSQTQEWKNEGVTNSNQGIATEGCWKWLKEKFLSFSFWDALCEDVKSTRYPAFARS